MARLHKIDLWKGAGKVAKAEATAQKEKKEPQWVEREAVFAEGWKPQEIGDSITGIVVRMTDEKTSHGPSRLLHLRTDEGPAAVWISGGLLGYVDVFMESNILVKITYTGEEDIGKASPMKTFKVQTSRK